MDIATMSNAELIAAMSAMQAQMNEQSKILTMLKNELKDKKSKAKAATKKAKEYKRYALSNEDLDFISIFLEDSVKKDGTNVAKSVLEDMRDLWRGYVAEHISTRAYDLSQLWGRMKQIKVENFKTYFEFRDFMAA